MNGSEGAIRTNGSAGSVRLVYRNMAPVRVSSITLTRMHRNDAFARSYRNDTFARCYNGGAFL